MADNIYNVGEKGFLIGIALKMLPPSLQLVTLTRSHSSAPYWVEIYVVTKVSWVSDWYMTFCEIDSCNVDRWCAWRSIQYPVRHR